METTTTAEFRAITHTNIKNLIRSAEYRKVERGGFLGLFKKVEYEDNFDAYLSQNTRLIEEMSGNGFLLFYDMVDFLKKYKSIDLIQPEYANINIDTILDRGENAYFLDYDYIQLLNKKFSNMSVEKEELTEFNTASDGFPNSDIIPYQQDQFKQLSLILKLFRDEVLYIRCE